MSAFRFHLIGAGKHVDLEVEAATINALHQAIACMRFVEGRLVEPDADGVQPEILIATSRVECIVQID